MVCSSCIEEKSSLKQAQELVQGGKAPKLWLQGFTHTHLKQAQGPVIGHMPYVCACVFYALMRMYTSTSLYPHATPWAPDHTCIHFCTCVQCIMCSGICIRKFTCVFLHTYMYSWVCSLSVLFRIIIFWLYFCILFFFSQCGAGARTQSLECTRQTLYHRATSLPLYQIFLMSVWHGIIWLSHNLIYSVAHWWLLRMFVTFFIDRSFF
jgi:hypothetical protein